MRQKARDQILTTYTSTTSYQGKKNDPLRIKFYKELFGFRYAWKTKNNTKVKHKAGLLDYEGCEAAGDSAIIVPEQYVPVYNSFFKKYQNIISCRVFAIQREVEI